MPMQLYTLEEVQKHQTRESLWCIHDNLVYDLTEFFQDHPGGEHLILEYAGKDVTKVMNDPTQHVHSELAYNLLKEQYLIGKVVDLDRQAITNQQNGTTSKDTKLSLNNAKEEDLLATDQDNNDFLSLKEPLFYQIWTSNFTKKHYMTQVHRARHLPYSARLFKSNLLEPLSLTPWWLIPAFYFPIMAILGYISLKMEGYVWFSIWIGLGTFLWTLLEYSLHRFLFHIDEFLPDNPKALAMHFIIHGIHHYLPMDRYRLVFPPFLGVMVATVLFGFYSLIFPLGARIAVLVGTGAGYVFYDLTHYYLHHERPRFKYFRELKTYHLAHHYKQSSLGYGITQTWWDQLFGTLLTVPSAYESSKNTTD